MHTSEQRHLDLYIEDLEIAEQIKHRGLRFGKRKVSVYLFLFIVSALFDLLFCISLPLYVCMYVCMYVCTLVLLACDV